ncbi:MAG: hypothetical protein KF766_00555 [Rhodocyclaceae bacterium]|nr:hypothetical protein [Rhodocyclaceae bacterium]MCP5296061.1 hypothetical protein [Zoogloeaceae bacterium]
MPSYSWTCRVCDHENNPNTESCDSCGFPALASGAEIEIAKAARFPPSPSPEPIAEASAIPVESQTSEQTQEREASPGLSIGHASFIVFFGFYLLLGAFSAWYNAKWPIFMPPQLDIIGLLLGAFGSPIGAYLGAAVLAVLGVVLVVAPFFLPRKTDA